MSSMPDEGGACMLTYRLDNTLSCFGKVTRGICDVRDGVLHSITETYNVSRDESGRITGTSDGEERVLAPDALASMNIFGFTPWIFDRCHEEFTEFLRSDKSGTDRGELPVPMVLDRLIKNGSLKITATPTEAQWFGVTYKEDRELVRSKLLEMLGIAQ
ncbi:MAG: hypothetical protein IJC18_02485 [Clostridia bacterium]|nr:hypothetical protein [Clostridia bacterium]